MHADSTCCRGWRGWITVSGGTGFSEQITIPEHIGHFIHETEHPIQISYQVCSCYTFLCISGIFIFLGYKVRLL